MAATVSQATETEDEGGTLTDQPTWMEGGGVADKVITLLPALIPPEAMERFASQVPSTPPPATLSAGVCELIGSSGVRSVSRENPY